MNDYIQFFVNFLREKSSIIVFIITVVNIIVAIYFDSEINRSNTQILEWYCVNHSLSENDINALKEASEGLIEKCIKPFENLDLPNTQILDNSKKFSLEIFSSTSMGQAVSYDNSIFYKPKMDKSEAYTLIDFSHSNENLSTINIYDLFTNEMVKNMKDINSDYLKGREKSIINGLRLHSLLKSHPNLFISRIYITCNDSSLVLFPAVSGVLRLNPGDRMWWKTLERSTENSYFENTNFGVSMPFIDRNEKLEGRFYLIRTFWHKFRELEKNYLLCIDLADESFEKKKKSYSDFLQ